MTIEELIATLQIELADAGEDVRECGDDWELGYTAGIRYILELLKKQVKYEKKKERKE